jgi:anti-sigma factor RsiW
MNKEMMSKGMKHNECRWIKDRLVFYSDDELPDDEHERVTAHLGDCPACQGELQLLRDSLKYASLVWEQTSVACVTRSGRATGGVVRTPHRRFGLSARLAAIVVAGLLVAGFLTARRYEWKVDSTASSPSRTAIRVPEEVVTPPSRSEPAIADIHALLARESQAARLAASAEFLATVPGLEEYRNRAEDYLVMHYSKPPTGRQPGDIPKEAPQSESLDP